MYGDRNAALANDLTKMFEKVQRAPLSVLLQAVKGKTLKGEYILVIAGIERVSRTAKDEGGRMKDETEEEEAEDEALEWEEESAGDADGE